MAQELLTERYQKQIAGVISCWDRVVIRGTLTTVGYPEGMGAYLSARGIRIFDFHEFAKPLTESVKANAERLAAEAGLEIDYIRKKNFRKEDRIRAVLRERGDHPGLVWVFSALEPCYTFRPWRDPASGRCYLRLKDGKCLHYYFYFIDPQLGLCYLRVPTWCPFRLQFYFNGHNWLASRMRKKGIAFEALDNSFVEIEDFEAAQALAEAFQVRQLERKLNRLTARYCPALQALGVGVYWSLMEVEYATDIVFRRRADVAAIYPRLLRTAIHSVQAEDSATFLGKRFSAQYEGEAESRYNIRIQGARVRHSLDKASLKMYDKFGRLLRIETTVRDGTYFSHYRKGEKRDGTTVRRQASMKKTIYSLGPLRELLAAANGRYLAFISAIEDRRAGSRRLRRLVRSVRQATRTYRGFHFFDKEDERVLQAIARGEFQLRGMTNGELRAQLPGHNSGQVSRLLKRLRVHGLIRKIARSYRYHLTALGKQVIALAFKLRETVVLPELDTLRATT
jgi:hypothetical protein